MNFSAACLLVFSAVLSAATVLAQETSVEGDAKAVVENPKPTWETQKQARTYQLAIPAPRGLITDRNGKPHSVRRDAALCTARQLLL